MGMNSGFFLGKSGTATESWWATAMRHEFTRLANNERERMQRSKIGISVVARPTCDSFTQRYGVRRRENAGAPFQLLPVDMDMSLVAADMEREFTDHVAAL